MPLHETLYIPLSALTLGIHHSCFFQGLSSFFEYPAHRLQGDAPGQPHLHHLVRQQPECPVRVSFGRCAARDGDQARFLLPSSLRSRPGRGRSLTAASSPSSTNRFRTLATVAALIKSASAISRSPSPWSALSSARARLTVRTDGLPRRETSLRRESSDSVSLTLYLMAAMPGYSPTERSYPSMAAFSYFYISIWKQF